MSASRRQTIGVIFGGRSVEHDVSVVTGHQIMRAFPPERYDIVPLYIDREGRWFTGEPLRDLKNYQDEVVSLAGVQPALLSPSAQHHGLIINPVPSGFFAKSQLKRLDVVFPAIHGSHGEDGTLQGLLELADIPYVGCGVLASAVANNKQMTKQVLKQAGLPVIDSVTFSRAEWEHDAESILARITSTLSFPMFVKPVSLGSSIGISRVDDERLLRASIDVAAHLDRSVLVEPAITGCIEINCAVMGDDSLPQPEHRVMPSVLEQPVSWEQFLTYEEKYLRGSEGMKSAQRIVPAPIDKALAERIQSIAVAAFRAIEGRGTARIDFLVQPEREAVYLNEINTMPGSLAFYLWQESGLSAAAVVERLVALAREAHAQKRRSTYNYRTSLISLTAARGVKGLKSAKTSQMDEKA
jgi:D-alanine-D-alanine ligase